MMNWRWILTSAVTLLINGQTGHAGSFTLGDRTFLLEGQPYVIKAAELHYPRIPKEYWDQRIKLTKALGMNTICLYTFWNAHEQTPGNFDFTGQNDLREFVRLCESNDMKVILRPGPYVCAEWEMGGLPWWLLKKEDIRLRENDPYFLERVEKFQSEVAKQVGDLTIQNGGPIIMIQVENEYGSYGEDKEYISQIRDILRRNFGDEILMFQCDWASNFTLNGLDDLLWTMNFGTGADIDSQFEKLKEMRPGSPLMCSEFWSGWFDKWGAAHETRSAGDMIDGIDEMLSKNISFSLYMTHGGTNWGHWAGANSPGYSPDVTSYDYDAPVSENGHPTEKFLLLRETLAKYLEPGDTLSPLPEIVQPVKVEKFSVEEYYPLWTNLPSPIKDKEIRPMEFYNMGYGSILYSTVLPEVSSGTILKIQEPHDYAQVFVNGEPVGILDRRKGETDLELKKYPAGAELEILVEATGRINFGRAIKDYKGITDCVMLVSEGKERVLNDWEVYLLPDEPEFYESWNVSEYEKTSNGHNMAGVYKGVFNVDNPSDTFLNLETWGKGVVYVNGHGIGRFWSIGPQQTLYVPGPWLKEGENEILIFDVKGPQERVVEGLEQPILDKLNLENEHNKYLQAIEKVRTHPENGWSAEVAEGTGWKEIVFPEPVETQLLKLEIISTHKNDVPAISELYLIDENGRRISREKWKIFASSEDLTTGNHSGDKIIDLQESTYWAPTVTEEISHYILIDLNEKHIITGMQYLPRMEAGAPGSVKDFYFLPLGEK